MSRSFDSGTGDLLNLLDSDSDAIELLNLPPLKRPASKAKKRKRNRAIYTQEMCSLWFLLKTVLVLSLIGGTCFIGVITYQLRQQVSELQEKLKNTKLESSNDGIPSEWQDLKSHVEEWRTSLDALKIKAASNLTALSEQVTQLKADLKNIKQQLEKNSEGGSRDDQGLAKSVATIGSDVESLKEKTTALEISTSKKFTTEDERLTQLESKVSLLVVSPAQPSPSSSVNSDHQPFSVPSVLTELRASIQTMNASLSDRIEGLSQQIGQQQNRLEAVELAKRPVTINTTVITQSIRRELLSYVKDLVSNASDSPASLPPGYVTPDTSFLDMIKQQVENITQVVSSLEKQITQDVPKTQNSTKGRTEMALQYLLHQFNVTESSLKSLNETVSRMGRESDRMMQLYVNEKNIVTRLSHEMNAVRQYLDKLPGPHDFPDDMFTSDNSTDVPDETLSTTTETPNSSTTNREKRDLAWNKELEDLFAN